MSDTLQERENEMSTERIDQIESKNADWCDDCHGYTHMPYCPSYGFVRGVSNQTVTSGHEPATRGGGDAAGLVPATVLALAKKNQQIYDTDLSNALVKAVEVAHAEHHSLVAERERLRAVIRDEITAIRIWQHAIHPRSDVQEGLAISLSKLESALSEQGSTSA